ncbi:glycosyltransferase 87 family protein [Solwaraspora sp. WMMA2080]|uniref:glycosyltransferase 87 family protein n=1 Tax=unclassified Solwaraspora TaxID=2627926 RepID=UPI00248CEE8E|nr:MULTISPECIES: glycosyltransferase 87 family protein [unclassified Solwaraspora]WBB95613.1 glycosyltransferase 87 family protein [Solwaraspora sp. WMMA2059]WBC20481.1 glycosyltransferase 87 family protein [Solwaraspora sp. WMMA2080]
MKSATVDPHPGPAIRPTDSRSTARPAVITAAAVLVTAFGLALLASYVFTRDPYWALRWTVDLKVYLASGLAVREGTSLYDVVIMSPLYGPMPYLYPPLTAVLFFVPLSYLPIGAASLVWNTASLVALGAVVWMTLKVAGVRDARVRGVLTVVVLILAAWLLPVRIQLIAGQINMFLLLLVLLDFRGGGGRWRGVGIGIAAGLKVTPLIFIGYLVVTRQWRAAGTALGAFLGTVVAGFAVLPRDSLTYWSGLVLHSSRAGGVFDTPNQSLSGALARVLEGEQFARWWLVILAGVAVFGLAVARYVYLRGSDFLGFSAAAVTGLLVSPVSWEHHWVYVIPLLIWLACRAYQTRSAWLAVATGVLVLVFTIRVFSLLGIPESPPSPMELAVWQKVVAAMFPLTGLALLILGPMWVRRDFPSEPAARPVEPPLRELVSASAR